jgi:competence protein ComEA
LAALRGSAPPTIRERAVQLIDRIPRDARPWAAALAAVGALLVGIATFAVVRLVGASHSSGAAGDDWALELPMAGAATTVAPSATPPAAMVVHAAGAVVQPGVYRLPQGARVDDLLAAAGGLTPDGDGDRVNLAASLTDGERVYVPRLGELDVPPLVAGSDAGPTSAEQTAHGTPIDLNRASQQQLEELPGVGPSIAAAIVEHRERNGPYRSVDDLVDVRGIGTARLEQLRDLVRV